MEEENDTEEILKSIPEKESESAAIALMNIRLSEKCFHCRSYSESNAALDYNYYYLSERYDQREEESMRIHSFPNIFSNGYISQRTADPATVLHHTVMHQNEFEVSQDEGGMMIQSEEKDSSSCCRITQLVQANFSGLSL